MTARVKMNWGTLNLIDVVLIVIVLLSAYNGWRRGFILGVLDLLGWALVLLAGLRFYQPLAKWLGGHVPLWSEGWERPLAFGFFGLLGVVSGPLLGQGML